MFVGLGQFPFDIGAFMEEAHGCWRQERMHQVEQPSEGSAGPRRYYVHGKRYDIGKARRVDRCGGLSKPHNFLKKSGFPEICLDQMDVELGPAHGKNQSRKSCAAADVKKTLTPRADAREVVEQLGGVEKMSAPQVRKRVDADQIDGILPFDQQIAILPEAVDYFT